MNFTCLCGATIEADDMPALGDTFIAHVRAEHTDWPYTDRAVRNFAEATQRLTGSTERLETIGDVTVQPVTSDVMDDWLQLFDHDGFADNPAWAACYCTEPHLAPAEAGDVDDASWQQRRTQMIDLLGTGRSYGYLAYVDGRPAGWVNASKRSDYALYRLGGDADPADADVVGISCFVIAPPYRRHGLAQRLLERVIADAPARGVAYVEAYPPTEAREGDSGNFRGPVSMYEALAFEPLEQRGPNTVMRLKV